MKFSLWHRFRHVLIRSRWRRWLLPLICAVPYVASILWLIYIKEAWIAQVLLAPLVMGVAMALLTLWLARQEFRR